MLSGSRDLLDSKRSENEKEIAYIQLLNITIIITIIIRTDGNQISLNYRRNECSEDTGILIIGENSNAQCKPPRVV